MARDDFPAPVQGFLLTHFLVVSDMDRSREFYRSMLGGTVVNERSPVIMRVANSWLILNEGGGPTDDKPDVILETPPDPNRTSAFLNIRDNYYPMAVGINEGARFQGWVLTLSSVIIIVCAVVILGAAIRKWAVLLTGGGPAPLPAES